MKTTRPMTKSPLALARTALATAKIALLPYSSKFSRHDYTQHQLFALLTLREFLKTDYRGLEAILRDWAELRDALGLKKVPDHSTLQKAARRLLEKRGSMPAGGRPSLRRGHAACSPPSPGRRSTPPGSRPGTSAATSSPGGPTSGGGNAPGPN